MSDADAAKGEAPPTLEELSFEHDIRRLTEDFQGREWVLAEVEEWLCHPGETFFLLTGEAGIGKSAIAARLAQVRDDIVARHFCIAGRNATIVPRTALRSLAAQLGRRLPGYGLALAKTIRPGELTIDVKIDVETLNGGQVTGVLIKNLTITDPRQEMEALLGAPLRAMADPGYPMLILIDSLDEAITYGSADNLVVLLAGLRDLPPWVRLLLTTRPEARVLSYFRDAPVYVVAAESQPNLEDLRRYVRYRVGGPALRERLRATANPVRPDVLLQRIAGVGDDGGLAGGNFLYARILLNDIARGAQPLDDLAALPKGLDGIYHDFLLRLAPEWESRYQPLLAILAVAREPLTREQLLRFGDKAARLIGGRMSATLLGMALNVLLQFFDARGDPGQERYALFHQSFRDYLGDATRSGRFACPAEDGHRAIAEYYLEHAADGWNTCDDYGLRHLPAHLAGAGPAAEWRYLLLDYGWLQAKLDRLGIQALLADFDLSRLADDDPLYKLGRALEQGAHVLAQDAGQLAPQLLGRLLDDEDRAVQSILAQARTQCPHPSLLPRTASLREAGALLCTLAGHTFGIVAVAVTPDGTRAVSASANGTLKVWDLASGRELRSLAGHTGAVNAVAVTPDGRSVISASYDNTLKVWDLASGQELRTLAGHTGPVCGVAVTPDGRRAVSASNDHTLKVWDLASGRELRALAGHRDMVNSVAVTPDGRCAVSASADNTLKVWYLGKGRELRTLAGHMGEVNGVAVTADGRRAVSASDDNTLKVWDLATGRELRTLAGHTIAVLGVAVTPDGRSAVSASMDGTLKVWDLASGRALHALTGHTFGVAAVVVTQDGTRAVSASLDGTVKVWDISPSLNSASAIGRGGLNSGREMRTLAGHMDPVQGVAVTPDGIRAVSASADGTLKVWDLASGRELRTLEGHTRGVLGVAVTPDGTRAVSASLDNTLKIWRLASGRALHTLKGHTSDVTAVVVTPNGTRAVSASEDNTLKVWDLASGRTLRTLAGHKGWVFGVAVTPDGTRAVSASHDQTLKVWDLASGRELRTLQGHTFWVRGVTVTPDGTRAVSASWDHTLKVWDLATSRELRTLEGHTDSVTGVAAMADGLSAVSVSHDTTLKVWDLASGACLATFHADGSLHACAVAPDGRTIVAGGASGRVHILRWEK